MKRYSPGFLAALLMCLSAIWLAGTIGPLAPYVRSVKENKPEAPAYQAETGVSAASDPAEALREWIETEAQKRRIPPSDAVIDRIWKAIPGYAGREVDVKATFEKARSLGLAPGAQDFPWVYRDIPPSVNLDDLPLQPIYRGNPAKPMVALMVNVAWGDEYLLPMLDTLDAHQVKATFFLDGTWLSKHESMAKEILQRGHELSNHAYSHPAMSRLDMAAQRREIGKTEELLKKLGVKNRWFAPPSGDYDDRTVRAAGEFGLRTVLWTLDTLDWRNPPADSIVSKIARHAGPGHLILMHPTASTRDALPGIISAIRAKGYHLGTVSQTLSADRVESLFTGRSD
jgi:probable sporulation protein (polysaccharide deacetylase family)